MVTLSPYLHVKGRVLRGIAVLVVVFLAVAKIKQLLTRRLPLSFDRQLNEQEFSALLQTLDVVNSIMTRAGVSFFMTSGTLLGSWRHHGQIPWDDDVDLAFLLQDSQRVKHLLDSFQPRYVLSTDHPKRWKFFPDTAAPIPNSDCKWRFPFVDINFILTNQTHIWNDDVENYPQEVFPLTDVSPLVLRPFQGRWLPAPRKTEAVLRQTYDDTIMTHCKTMSYNHRKETGGHMVLTVPCWTLMDKYPFLQRVPMAGGGCQEVLMMNGTVLSWMAFPHQAC